MSEQWWFHRKVLWSCPAGFWLSCHPAFAVVATFGSLVPNEQHLFVPASSKMSLPATPGSWYKKEQIKSTFGVGMFFRRIFLGLCQKDSSEMSFQFHDPWAILATLPHVYGNPVQKQPCHVKMQAWRTRGPGKKEAMSLKSSQSGDPPNRCVMRVWLKATNIPPNTQLYFWQFDFGEFCLIHFTMHRGIQLSGGEWELGDFFGW